MKTLCAKVFLGLATVIAWPSIASVQPQNTSSSVPTAKPIIASVSRVNGQYTLKISPNPVPGKDNLQVLYELSKLHGKDYPIIEMLEETAKIEDLGQVAGLAAKVPMTNVKSFVHRNGYMFEVKSGKAIRFSTDGPF